MDPHYGKIFCRLNTDVSCMIDCFFVFLLFFSIIISDAILQQEVNMNSTKLIQAR